MKALSNSQGSTLALLDTDSTTNQSSKVLFKTKNSHTRYLAIVTNTHAQWKRFPRTQAGSSGSLVSNTACCPTGSEAPSLGPQRNPAALLPYSAAWRGVRGGVSRKCMSAQATAVAPERQMDRDRERVRRVAATRGRRSESSLLTPSSELKAAKSHSLTAKV